jgi:hypothetical protein
MVYLANAVSEWEIKILTETTARSNWKTRSCNIKIKKRKDSKTYQASRLKNINSTN